MTDPVDHGTLPYRIAVLCYLHDDTDRLLLLHRNKSPNAGLYSPVGGKLEVAHGESPHDAAVREIGEETGLTMAANEIRMMGIVSETAYEGQTHWLIFLFEVTRPIRPDEIPTMAFDEGTLEWVSEDDVEALPIPRTDRDIIWPLIRKHRGGFFVVHIDCRDGKLDWQVREAT